MKWFGKILCFIGFHNVVTGEGEKWGKTIMRPSFYNTKGKEEEKCWMCLDCKFLYDPEEIKIQKNHEELFYRHIVAEAIERKKHNEI